MMITKRRKDVALDALQSQFFSRAAWHVTVDTVFGKVDALMRKEAAITFAFVTLHAAVGKQLSISTLVVVRVMAIETGHLRLLKADAL